MAYTPTFTAGSRKTWAMLNAQHRAHIRDTWVTERDYRAWGGEASTGATRYEMRALWTAWYLARQDGISAMVRFDDGTERHAFVYLRPGHETAEITDTSKRWRFPPQWPSNPKGNQQMARRPTVNIVAPGPQHHEVVQDIYLHHRRRIHHVHEADEHIEHGAPQETTIELAEAHVQITHRPGIGGFLMDMITGPRTVDRGKLQAASRPAAQIEAPKGGAMPSQMPTVAGVPAHLLTKKGG